MIDISKLKNGLAESIDIDENITFTKEDIKYTDIVRLENVHAKGKISRIEENIYRLELLITGNMVLLCARSLEEVDYPINITLDENISEENSEKPLILQNGLDIFSIVCENIVLEVPLRVIKEDADFIKSGDGWNFQLEEDKALDNPFSQLKSMLDMEEKK